MSKMGEEIIEALNEALAHAKGEKEYKTTTVTVAPLPAYNSEKIKEIRANLGMTQSLFATFLGVSCRTVEAWERGTNIPNGSACRLLAMAEQDRELPERFNIITRKQHMSRA